MSTHNLLRTLEEKSVEKPSHPLVIRHYPQNYMQAHANGERSRASPTRTPRHPSGGPTKSDADHHQLPAGCPSPQVIPRAPGPLCTRPSPQPPSRAGAEPDSAARRGSDPDHDSPGKSTPSSGEPYTSSAYPSLRQAFRPHFLLAVVSPRG